MPRLLTADEVTRQLVDLDGWSETGQTLTRTYELADFSAALDLVVLIGHEAEAMDHHPDIDIRWNRVTLALSTHSEGGLTQLDVELAHRIEGLAGLAE